MNKQISLTVPETLFNKSQVYSKEMGYKNIQEFILDSLRRRTFVSEDERLRKIEEAMDKDPNLRVFHSKKELLEHFDSL